MKELLDKAAKAYYEGNPIMSDEAFDALADEYGYDQVGNPDSRGIEHKFRLYSLQKVYEGEDSPPFNSDDGVVVTPKLDGTAIAILYKDGYLVRALTRGDGIRSEKDITDKVHAWAEIPNELEDKRKGYIQISGEVVAPSSVPNPRNYAAGALGLKSVEDFLERSLYFFAYSVQPYNTFDTYWEELDFIDDNGIKSVLSTWAESFPQDGKVARMYSTKEFLNVGFTNHHPRGAYAIKTRKEGVVTKLLGVIWQVGKSGKVSPVAQLNPIEIGGATVSRATLHNIKYINELGLEIGCNVEVIRSGEIIPRVVRRV